MTVSAKVLVQNCLSAKLAINWDQFKEKGFASTRSNAQLFVKPLEREENQKI